MGTGFDTSHLFQVKTAAQIVAADLARLGFRVDRTPTIRAATESWHVKGEVRVVLGGEEGVQVYAFAEPERYNLEWKADFSGSAPAEVVLSMLLKTVGG